MKGYHKTYSENFSEKPGKKAGKDKRTRKSSVLEAKEAVDPPKQTKTRRT